MEVGATRAIGLWPEPCGSGVVGHASLRAERASMSWMRDFIPSHLLLDDGLGTLNIPIHLGSADCTPLQLHLAVISRKSRPDI